MLITDMDEADDETGDDSLRKFRGGLTNPDGSPPTELLRETEKRSPHRILSFLAQHSDQEYTSREISDRLEISHSTTRTVLDLLSDRDLVQQDGSAWTLGEDDRLAVYEGLQSSLNAIEERYDDQWEGWEDTARDPRCEKG